MPSGSNPSLPGPEGKGPPAIVVEEFGMGPSPKTPDPLIGQKVGNYEIVRELGSGGMGTVYQARHVLMSSGRAAIKVPHPDVWRDTNYQDHFFKEADILFSLRHRNIVRATEYVALPDGRYCLMMEFVHGKTLSDFLEETTRTEHGKETLYATPVEPRTALRFAIQIAEGLAAAHEAGVVHRDLKPANIIVDEKETARIADVDVPTVRIYDFGLASQPVLNLQNRGPLQTLRAGTPAYLAPEQARALPTDSRTDLYSFGVVLFELLTGRLPFDGDELALCKSHAYDTAPLLRTFDRSIPEEIEGLIARLLEKDPEKRPPSALAVRSELEVRLKQLENRNERTNVVVNPLLTPRSGSTAVTAPANPTGPTPEEAAFPKRRTGWVWAVLVVLLLVGAGVAWKATSGLPTESSATPVPVPVALQPPVPAEPPSVAEVAPVPPAPVPTSEPDEAVSPEELSPLVPVRPKVASISRVEISKTTCQPDGRWRQQVRDDLKKIQQRASATAAGFDQFGKAEARIEALTTQATSSEDCEKVEKQLAALTKQFPERK